MLQTKARYLTIVELISREQYWDDAQQCPARDYLNIEVPSDYPLPQFAITKVAESHPGYMVGGVTEIDLDNAAEEF